MNKPMQIDKQLLNYLKQNGWNLDRNVSTEQVNSEIKKFGYCTTFYSDRILSSFQGLDFSPQVMDSKEGRFQFRVFFDGYNAVRDDPDTISFCEEIVDKCLTVVGKRLTPVGYIGDFDGILMCSENGDIFLYVATMDELTLIGESIFEALLLMLFGKGIARILSTSVVVHRIDQQTKYLSERYGWNVFRDVSTEQAQICLKKAGFHVNEHSKQLLSLYEGLELHPLFTSCAKNMEDKCFQFKILFDAQTVSKVNPDRISDSEKIYGNQLTPLALIGQDDGVLMCAEQGEILALKTINHELAIVGKSIYEALDLLLFNKGTPSILDEENE